VDHRIFEDNHEELSKLKNIEVLHLGLFDLTVWYWSPFPS